MPTVGLTRLRLRSLRFLPHFVPQAFASARQARHSSGYLDGAVLAERSLAFWTLTVWRDAQAMRDFMLADAHHRAMPGLLDWCDEAAVARWETGEPSLPSWQEADRRLRQDGRPSHVRHPTPAHGTLTHAPPRTGRGLRLSPASGREPLGPRP